MKLFETKEDIARKIKQKREELGIKDQKIFAQMLGMKPSQYNRYETGKQRPKDKTLEKILSYGGLPAGVDLWREPDIEYQTKSTEEDEYICYLRKIFKTGLDGITDPLKAHIKAAFVAALASQNRNEGKEDG